MGLDMYLDKSLDISEYDKNDKTLVDKVMALIGVEDKSGNYRHIEVIVPAIYWRKSNQIHKWFVDNTQDGIDNCQRVDVEIEKLKELLDVVTKQLNNKEKIILKPQSGFFFGGTEIDEWYWKDLEQTEQELKREIEFAEKEKEKKRFWSFTYRASW
jgi:hypothetical protein